ncbi:hypothetical protein OEIGOIKO_06991 [Streptomyces chrestomyceticus JCM 4735]|uniref:Uncharacterized protein n=1 Tax=Streptomyces chrestomyceticus JCM 4735 TaxID=1306181 RepID=A0A7U9L150_9ACTN|nr:hypothetical protein [Streptomyces chrestomyceticus]GCD39162.1 hypothetical protein OEIGOIKO_06991 [Streptomyces chrestomyceticus JCM 4735]
MKDRDRYAFIDQHPEPTTAAEALAHVLELFADAPDGHLMIQATSGMYRPGARTGLTMGDLRELSAALSGRVTGDPGTQENPMLYCSGLPPAADLGTEQMNGTGCAEGRRIERAATALESGRAVPPEGQGPQAMADMLRTAHERGALGGAAASGRRGASWPSRGRKPGSRSR